MELKETEKRLLEAVSKIIEEEGFSQAEGRGFEPRLPLS